MFYSEKFEIADESVRYLEEYTHYYNNKKTSPARKEMSLVNTEPILK